MMKASQSTMNSSSYVPDGKVSSSSNSNTNKNENKDEVLFDEELDDEKECVDNEKQCCGAGDEDEDLVASTPRRVSDTSESVPDTPSNEDYRDFYLNSAAEIKVTLGTPPPKRKGPRGGVASAFPVKLHAMLTRGQFDGTDAIVSWQPHGRAFTVHQSTVFVEELMPRYFKQSKMTSFQRQLNLYGFLRKTDGTDRGSYYHELFLRGRPDLADIMVRTRVKGDNKRRVQQEPDFYKMPFCPQDPDPRQHSQKHADASDSHHRGHKVRSTPHRGSSRYYRGEEAMNRSPRAGYTTAYYGPGYSRGAAEEYREPDDAPSQAAKVTPSSARNPVTGYLTGNMTLPSSSFFLDDEPLLHAPEDSEWTPPPFPELHRASPHRRERAPPQFIQPTYYPNMVSPKSEEHGHHSYSESSSRMPRYHNREEYHHERRLFRERPPVEASRPPYHAAARYPGGPPRWTMEDNHHLPSPPRRQSPSPRSYAHRRLSSRGSYNMFFEGQLFEPVDEPSLEMFEDSIQL